MAPPRFSYPDGNGVTHLTLSPEGPETYVTFSSLERHQDLIELATFRGHPTARQFGNQLVRSAWRSTDIALLGSAAIE